MNNPCFILILNLQSLSKRCNLYVIFMKYLLMKKVKQQFGKNMKDLLQLSKDLTKIFMKFLLIFIQIDILHKNVLAHLVSFSFFLKIVFMNSAWKNINTNNQEILFNSKHFYLFLLWEPFKCTICETRYAQNSKTWLEYTNYISSWH